MEIHPLAEAAGSNPLLPPQINHLKPYTMFLRSRCAYACGEHEMSAVGSAAGQPRAEWFTLKRLPQGTTDSREVK